MRTLIIVLCLLCNFLKLSAQKNVFVAIDNNIYSDNYLDSLSKNIKADSSLNLKIYFISRNNGRWKQIKLEVTENFVIRIDEFGNCTKIKGHFSKLEKLESFSDYYLFQPEKNSPSDEVQFMFLKQKSKLVTILSLNNQLYDYLIKNESQFNIDKKLMKLYLKY
jgi:hypothetical protein